MFFLFLKPCPIQNLTQLEIAIFLKFSVFSHNKVNSKILGKIIEQKCTSPKKQTKKHFVIIVWHKKKRIYGKLWAMKTDLSFGDIVKSQHKRINKIKILGLDQEEVQLSVYSQDKVTLIVNTGSGNP